MSGKNEYKSRVYTDRPEYADYDAPRKFQTIQGIVAKRLLEHPSAICSYSGGSDSDILLDVIERARKLFDLPPVKYAFFNTGLEMEATKRHVREQAQKYGVEITDKWIALIDYFSNDEIPENQKTERDIPLYHMYFYQLGTGYGDRYDASVSAEDMKLMSLNKFGFSEE